ncbi:hypothetical protein G6N74_04255 [Mesorhizobium sp. CGMCC 1.15528]|uniref:Uncharacterized protein n=1 Tax=Mesorhizobium zhangyense TaxID=1776730 RepID=A0A7C9V737_9HYPH|nr:hypothetical protein [Mesorhizobium zhangyense]NGN40266.1 hypothetical protein [Mesorhizobium zhangyense]
MDQKTAEFILSLQEEIDGLWRYLGHKDRADGFHQQAESIREKTDAYRNEFRDFHLRIFDQSERYINVVAVVGYAAYFATWSFAKELLLKEEVAFVALMGMISAGLFCLWEMLVIQYRMKQLGELGQAFRDMISPDDFEPIRQAILNREMKWTLFLTPIWRISLTVCMITVFIGAAVMARRAYLSL